MTSSRSSTWFPLGPLLLNLPLGIIYFAVLITGVSLGAGLFITLLGIPVLIGTGWMVRTFGNIERARLNAFLGTTFREPYRDAAQDAGWMARLLSIGKDPATWRDFLYLMLRLPMGIFTFVVTVTTWAVGLGLLGSPVAYWFGVFHVYFGGRTFDGPRAATLATFPLPSSLSRPKAGISRPLLSGWVVLMPTRFVCSINSGVPPHHQSSSVRLGKLELPVPSAL